MTDRTRRGSRKVPYDVGVIHGRFQVLHHDHLRYLLAGKALCRFLVVGITNPDPTRARREAADPARSEPDANPLTYWERALLVRAALTGAGVPLADFAVVPFPVSDPDLYGHYVPLDAVFFLTIYDDWGRRKLRYFRERGLRTHVLWEVPATEKGQSAGAIRARMARGRAWAAEVPGAVARLLRAWKVPQRIRCGAQRKLKRGRGPAGSKV